MNDSEKLIERRFSNPFYFKTILNREYLHAIFLARKQFPFWRHVRGDFPLPRPIQHYLLIGLWWDKQLGGKILDVGSRHNTIREVLKKDATLVDKNNPNLPAFDLEKEALPFSDKQFDTVVCMDTLEHVDRAHGVIADLCRASKEYVIISLPNCWRGMMKPIVHGGGGLGSYGFPPEAPFDRHRWFFSTEDIEQFLIYNAAKNGFAVEDIAYHMPKTRLWHKVVYGLFRMFPERYAKNFFVETCFILLKRKTS
jgi:hypothetical protein